MSSTDVWAALAARLDATRLRPRLAPDIEVRAFEVARGDPYVMIANPRDLVHYRLAPAEADLLPLLDGTHTVGDLVVRRLRDSGELDLGNVVDLVRSLEAGNFLDHPYLDVDAALDKAVFPPTWRSRGDRFLRTLSVEWSGAERLVRALYRVVRVFFTLVGRIVGALIAVAGIAAFVDVVATRHFHLTNRRPGLAFLVLLALDLLIIFLHELGHAATLVHYGRRVKGAGFRIYFGSPAFFIESSDALMLGRRQRMVQAFAGPAAEMMAAGLAAIVLWFIADGPIASTLYQFVVINYFVLFLNLVPLLELDGYWILSDALQLPDLRPRSLAFVRRELWHKLRHREGLSRGEIGLAAYGIVGVAFTIACVASAWFFWRRVFGDTALQMWHGGTGGRLLLLLLVAFFGGPVIRALIDAGRSVARAGRARVAAWRFRAQSRWRVEAAEAFDRSAVFGDLPVEVLNDLAGRVRLRPVAPGQAVVRQGERADACYMVRRGRLEAMEEAIEGHGQGRVLRSIGPGEGFGELALIGATVRNATVRAVERSEVFEVDKGTFDRLLADSVHTPRFATTLHESVQLRRLRPFAHLGPDELMALVDHGRWLSVQPGEEVVRQGEAGDAFYVIGAGQVDVIEDGQIVRTRGAGEHFGEIALLLDQPRMATVRAATPSRIYRLDREGFDDLVAAEFRRGRLRLNAAVDRGLEH